MGDELEQTALHLEGHGDDEGKEEQHLEDEKSEDLHGRQSVKRSGAPNGNVCGPVRRSNSWLLEYVLLV